MRKLKSLLLVLMVVSAAGAAQAAWKDEPAVKALYEKAKQEGEVVIWGPARSEIEWVEAAFSKVFPGIKVPFVGDNDVFTRAITEARGGRHQFDVMWTSINGGILLSTRNLAAKADWQALGVKNAETAFDGQMLFANRALWIVTFNPDKAKAADLPDTWEGYLDPKFKDKMIANPFLLPRLAGSLSLSWGEDKAIDFVRKLVNRQDIMLTRAPRETFLKSGERTIALGEIDGTYRRQAKLGNPYGVKVPQPVVFTQFGSMVMANAPHPNAARLLAAWLATDEGKAARLEATGRLEYDKPDSEFARRLAAGQIPVIIEKPEDAKRRDDAINKAMPIVARRER
ncbi:MAG: extracellular solute-binding protein [Rhizobiales bacterium]|nr:extracellular solute-binding protein [Hyphomicrobiales bacterium]